MTELPAAYYLPLGDGYFEPTEATTSPWDTRAQHGGPPAALLACCLDDAFGRPDLRVARISMDFLGPIPRTPSRVQTGLLRPGRRTQLSEASLWAGDRRVAVARVWHLATGPGPEARETDPVLGNFGLGPADGEVSAAPARPAMPGSERTRRVCPLTCPVPSRRRSSTAWRRTGGTARPPSGGPSPAGTTAAPAPRMCGRACESRW